VSGPVRHINCFESFPRAIPKRFQSVLKVFQSDSKVFQSNLQVFQSIPKVFKIKVCRRTKSLKAFESNLTFNFAMPSKKGKSKGATVPRAQHTTNQACPSVGCLYNAEMRDIRLDTLQLHVRNQHKIFKTDPCYPTLGSGQKRGQVQNDEQDVQNDPVQEPNQDQTIQNNAPNDLDDSLERSNVDETNQSNAPSDEDVNTQDSDSEPNSEKNQEQQSDASLDDTNPQVIENPQASTSASSLTKDLSNSEEVHHTDPEQQ